MITASIVPEKERLDFYPSITNNFATLEALVYNVSDDILEAYHGAYWEFVKLSNGGRFAYPVIDTPVTVVNPINQHKETLSAEAAGICVWVFALGLVRFREYQRELIEFANEHAEKDKIFRVLQ